MTGVGSSREPLLQEVRLDIQSASDEIMPSLSKRVPSVRAELDCGSTCGLTDAAGGSESSKEREKARRKLMYAIALCLGFMIVEVIGGLWANSLAILTDAAHLLSDVAGFAISLFALWMASWEATPRHTFGYHRMEILGALVSMQLIWAITGILVYEAITRILYTHEPVNGKVMFVTAAFGVAVNILMTLLLGHSHGHSHGGHGHDHDHGHGHSHSHGHGASSGKKGGVVNGGGGGDAHGCSANDAGHEHKHDGHGHAHAHAGGDAAAAAAAHDKKRAAKASTNGILALGGHGSPGPSRGGDGHSGHGGHGHGHGRSGSIGGAHSATTHEPAALQHQAAAPEASKQNINLKGAYLHVIGDLIQSVGVMIGGAIIWVKPEWEIVDLICTLLFSVLVLFTTFNMLRDVMEVLMESTPREINAAELEQGLARLQDVVDVHELHIWAITLGKVVLACHVRIQPNGDTTEVLHQVLEYCEKEYGITHATVQVERQNEEGDESEPEAANSHLGHGH
eukprot:jgi/Mesen1/4539/ME000232S03796